jgi:hypothetical protein
MALDVRGRGEPKTELRLKPCIAAIFCANARYAPETHGIHPASAADSGEF